MLILRIEGRAFFLNAQRIGDKMRAHRADDRPSVMLDCSALIDIESTALKMLIEAEDRLRDDGITLWLAALNPEVLTVVQQSPLGDTLGRARMFFNVQSAVARLRATAVEADRRQPLDHFARGSLVGLANAAATFTANGATPSASDTLDTAAITESLIREHQKRGGAAHWSGAVRHHPRGRAWLSSDVLHFPTQREVRGRARREPERRLEKLDGVRLQQSGLQHRRPESSQVRWRREIGAGAEQTRVVTPRCFLHAQLRVHIRPWEVERGGV